MEPQAESIPEMMNCMNIKNIYMNLEVEIPEDVMYCPYNGTYEEKIHKAMNDNNISMVRSLIYYRDNMITREKKIKELNGIIRSNSHKFQEQL